MFPRPQWWAAFLQDDRRSSIEVARQPALVRAARTEMASQEFGGHFELIEPMRSRKDIHTSDQIFQSPQRRMMNPKAGREEKTRKMTRAKIINFPSLPVKRPCNLDSSAVFATANKRVKEPVQTSIWEGIHSTTQDITLRGATVILLPGYTTTDNKHRKKGVIGLLLQLSMIHELRTSVMCTIDAPHIMLFGVGPGGLGLLHFAYAGHYPALIY